jgi:hypothetical protein
MLKREVLESKRSPGWLTSFLDWAIYQMAKWMADNAGSNKKSEHATLQEIKIPPWAEKAHKTRLPEQFKPKPRS